MPRNDTKTYAPLNEQKYVHWSRSLRIWWTVIKRFGLPERIVTDKLRSYGAVRLKIAYGLKHRSHKSLSTRADHSQLPFRKRERCMQGFCSPGGLQRFVTCQSAARNRFLIPAPAVPQTNHAVTE